MAQNWEVGHADMTVADLSNNQHQYELKDVRNKSAGQILFKQYKYIERPSFVEVLRSGLQLSLAVAIDFTASNGEMSNPRSLHAFSRHGDSFN